jgi:hypothetical protein
MDEVPNGLRLEIRPASRTSRVDVTIRDDAGHVLASERCNLTDAEGRAEAAQELCRQLHARGVERTPAEVGQVLETQWLQYVEGRARDEALAAAPAAAGEAEDEDDQAERLLAAMPEDIRLEAEARLRDPDLLQRIVEDIEAQGVAGERELGATLYLIGTGRKLTRPPAGRVKGPTSSGKSHIILAVAGLFPAEAVIFATTMTPQSLFHMPPGALRHKWIVAGERRRDDESDTAEATRALREMISAGRLSKLMPLKIGNELETVLIRQEGPIAFVESTSLESVFDEDENRCLSLFTDERDEQTRRVIDRVALEAAAGGPARGAGRTVQLHHAIQRALRRKEIVIPYAVALGKRIPAKRVEARRAFPHLLGMIRASALLHQFQRPVDGEERLVAVRDDYRVARRLVEEPMRRLLGGAVSEPARRFFERLRSWFENQVFTSKEARAREETSRASVYGWLGELNRAGVLEQLEAARGPKPATWRVTNEAPQKAQEGTLPTEEEVFGV